MRVLYEVLIIVGAVASSVPGSMCGCESSMPALKEFYNATNGHLWTVSSGWGSRNCTVSWFGVMCTRDGIVTISLTNNNLTGTLAESLQNLTALTSLILSYNSIGGQLPPSWSQLPMIRELHLDHNHLRGPLPESWSTMGRTLSFSLILDSNPIYSALPENWKDMQAIEVLSLASCSLYGTLPSSWNFQSIRLLFLNDNALSGTMPPSWNTMGGSGEFYFANMSNNCLFGPVPWATSSDPPSGIDTCGTRLDLGANCTRTPAFWPTYCSRTSTVMQRATSKLIDQLKSLSVTGSGPDSSTAWGFQTMSTSGANVFESPSYLTMTPSALMENGFGAEPTELASAASAPLAATALISAFSGVDAGSAQALLSALQSPCMITFSNSKSNNVKSTDSAPRALSIALSPLVLFGDDDTIDAFEVAIGNAGLSVACLLAHFTATFLHFCFNDVLSWKTVLCWHNRQLVCTKSAAVFRFPSLSINFAMYLVPGVAWGVLTLMSSTTTRRLEVALGSAIGLGGIVCLGVLLSAVVLRRWILDRDYGLTFCDFRDAHPFSPPIPRSIAAIICSRRGQWGPVGRRAAFGSPIATSFLPEHMRWMWAVSPFVSLLAVALNTVQPSQEHLGVACDAIQTTLIALFSAAAFSFGWVLPHRSILRSLLSCCSAAHNALVALLGMLARHQRVEQDTVLVVAAVGSYTSMVLGIVVVCIGFLEHRLLQRKTTVRLAPQCKNLLTDTTHAQNHSGTIATMQREAALASLVACACQAYNNEGGGDRLL